MDNLPRTLIPRVGDSFKLCLERWHIRLNKRNETISIRHADDRRRLHPRCFIVQKLLEPETQPAFPLTGFRVYPPEANQNGIVGPAEAVARIEDAGVVTLRIGITKSRNIDAGAQWFKPDLMWSNEVGDE